MRNIGGDGISHESSRHYSQYSDISEISYGDIPTNGQDAGSRTLKQDTEEDDEYIGDEFCDWGEPSEVSDIEEQIDKEYCHRHVRVDKNSYENPELSGHSASCQPSGYSKKIKRD